MRWISLWPHQPGEYTTLYPTLATSRAVRAKMALALDFHITGAASQAHAHLTQRSRCSANALDTCGSVHIQRQEERTLAARGLDRMISQHRSGGE